MSRGYGKRQKEILAYLQERPGETTYETLRWDFFFSKEPSTSEALGGDASLPAKLNCSLTRAVNSMLRTSHSGIIECRRPLQSLDELFMHYPNKTLSVRTRFLRQKLLPSLLGSRCSSVRRKYGLRENEEFYLKALSNSDRAVIRKQWGFVRSSLFHCIGSQSSSPPIDLFHLVAAGDELLLGESDLSSSRSFHECSSDICASGYLSAPLSALVHDLSELILPETARGRLGLKSTLYAVAQLNDTEQRIHYGVLDTLAREQPSIMELLSDQIEGRDEDWVRPQRDNFDPDLQKLLDMSALKEFRFLQFVG